MRRSSLVLIAPALIACIMLINGCGSDEDQLASVQRLDAEADQFALRRRAILEQATLPVLAESLRAESARWIEPWNSPALRIVIQRPTRELAELRRLLVASPPDAGALLGMLALRTADSTEFNALPSAFRAATLNDAFGRAPTWNFCGYATRWEDAGLAFIQDWAVTRPVALALLSDTTSAPVWGSLGAMQLNALRLRKRDYAWLLLRAIDHGVPPGYVIGGAIPMDRAQRDTIIRREYGR